MRLDSARELKFTLLEQILSGRLGAIVPRAADLALAAVNLMADTSRQASLALGIARHSPRDFRLAVRIQQRPLHESPIVELVRKQSRGEADIRYIGRVRPAVARPGPKPWMRERCRPLLIGCSVGHPTTTAGTLGAFVYDRRDPRRCAILSNNHVLAAENVGKKGDLIVQPAPVDGGRLARQSVARLARFVRLRPRATNRIDAAIAIIEPGVEFDPSKLRGLGTLRGTAGGLDIGDEVAKIGRSTGVTRGRVSAIEVDNIVVDYGLGRLRFDDQIEIEGIGRAGSRTRPCPFSAAGDSGALIITSTLDAAALLFAGSDHGGPAERGLTYATPISPVLKALRVSLRSS